MMIEYHYDPATCVLHAEEARPHLARRSSVYLPVPTGLDAEQAAGVLLYGASRCAAEIEKDRARSRGLYAAHKQAGKTYEEIKSLIRDAEWARLDARASATVSFVVNVRVEGAQHTLSSGDLEIL